MIQGRDNGNAAKVGAYFDQAAVQFDTFYDHKRSRFMQWVDRQFRSDMFERFRLTFEAIEPLKDATVLDIGCGSGPYVVEAARRGSRRVVGLDMAPPMLGLARERAQKAGVAERCEFALGTFPQAVPPGVFDRAIVMGVMDYVPDPLKFLSTLAQRVRGRASVSFPSRHWFRTPLRQIRYRIKKCPVFFFDRQTIEELMRNAGFTDVRIDKIPGAGMDYVASGRGAAAE
jgi:2-polyprenyl-3-methyl-5-hydroxy-6-metoxy-1,4-benzoquinol methylase